MNLKEKVEKKPELLKEWLPHPDVLYDRTIATPCALQAFL